MWYELKTVLFGLLPLLMTDTFGNSLNSCDVSDTQRSVSCGGYDVTNRTTCLQYSNCCYNKNKQPNCYTGKVSIADLENAFSTLRKLEKPTDQSNSRFLLSFRQIDPEILGLEAKVETENRLLVNSADQTPFNTGLPVCPVRIPICQRSRCQPNNPIADVEPLICLSNPTCCFDGNLYIYRFLYGDGFMGGSPVCYSGPSARKYIEMAQLAIPWNPFFQSAVVRVFEVLMETTYKQETDVCTLANMMDSPFQRSPMCGWIGITKLECRLIGCCYSINTGRCTYPSLKLMEQFYSVEHYPQMVANSANETKCFDTVFIPTLFHRLPCLQDGNSTSNSRTLYSCPRLQCCRDPFALLPGAIGLPGTHTGNTLPPNLLNATPLQLLTLQTNPGSSTMDTLSAIYCPFYFSPSPGFPDLTDSVKGCCTRNACYHVKTSPVFPTITPPNLHSWSDWSGWSSCDSTCGEGRRLSRRSCVSSSMSPVSPVLCAGLDVKYDSCNLNACPIAAQESWNSWGNWHPCPQSCGGALQIRMRDCASSLAQTVDPRRCTGSRFDMRPCGDLPCPSWDIWSEYGPCNASCNNTGVKLRSRLCVATNGEILNSTSCPGQSTDYVACTGTVCAEWAGWAAWGRCAGDCRRYRSKYCVREGTRVSDTSCRFRSSVQFTTCYTGACTSAPATPWVSWGVWSNWQGCSSNCVPGNRTRWRECLYLSKSYWLIHHSFCGFVYGEPPLEQESERCNTTCV